VEEPEGLAGEGDSPHTAAVDAGAADAAQHPAIQLQVAVAFRIRQPRWSGYG
jgi:hypothetical protein